MYPSGRLARSTNSNYETKWWLNDVVEEKAGVTPADNHLAKRPVKTHIFSREEIEAFAEEKLKAVKDIDKKMDFLDIIKSAVALQSSLLLTDNHAALQKGSLPLGLSIPAIPYSNQELVNLPVWLIEDVSSKWILNMNHGISSQYVLICTSLTPCEI
jgi:glutaredoxin-related protein